MAASAQRTSWMAMCRPRRACSSCMPRWRSDQHQSRQLRAACTLTTTLLTLPHNTPSFVTPSPDQLTTALQTLVTFTPCSTTAIQACAESQIVGRPLRHRRQQGGGCKTQWRGAPSAECVRSQLPLRCDDRLRWPRAREREPFLSAHCTVHPGNSQHARALHQRDHGHRRPPRWAPPPHRHLPPPPRRRHLRSVPRPSTLV